MFLNKDSFLIKVSGMNNFLSIGQYLVQIEYGYNKLWANDTGRNLKGKTTGTLLGVVDKFKLTFGPLTQTELELISPILNKAWQTVKYYNPDTKTMIEEQTYAGDWATLNKTTFENIARANESFDISIIATTPRRS